MHNYQYNTDDNNKWWNNKLPKIDNERQKYLNARMNNHSPPTFEPSYNSSFINNYFHDKRKKFLNQELKKETPIKKKVVLINNENGEQIIENIEKLNKKMKKIIEKSEIINIDVINEKISEIIKIVDEHNKTLIDWYDNKYFSDQEKLFKSIENFDLNFEDFRKNDYVCVK